MSAQQNLFESICKRAVCKYIYKYVKVASKASSVSDRNTREKALQKDNTNGCRSKIKALLRK